MQLHPSFKHRFGKKLEEYWRVESNGCWLWLGAVHTTGYPAWKSWEYPRNYIYELYKGKLKADERLLGRHCGFKRCVNPDHQIKVKGLKEKIVSESKKSVDLATLEALDRMVDRGELLCPTGNRFTQILELVDANLAYFVREAPEGKYAKPTSWGLEVVAHRRRRALR